MLTYFIQINAQEFTKIYKIVKEKVKPVNAPWLNPLKPPENLLNERKASLKIVDKKDDSGIEYGTTVILSFNEVEE